MVKLYHTRVFILWWCMSPHSPLFSFRKRKTTLERVFGELNCQNGYADRYSVCRMQYPEYHTRFSLIPFYHINYRLSRPFMKFLKKIATVYTADIPPMATTDWIWHTPLAVILFHFSLQQFAPDTHPQTLQQFQDHTSPPYAKAKKRSRPFQPTSDRKIAKWEKMVVKMAKSGKI